MTKRTILVGVMAFAMLAACSKQAPPEQHVDEEAIAPAADGPQLPPPALDRSEKAAGLLTLIDASPQCEPYRAQLEEAGKTPADVPLPVDMNQIVARAHQAGCSRKP